MPIGSIPAHLEHQEELGSMRLHCSNSIGFALSYLYNYVPLDQSFENLIVLNSNDSFDYSAPMRIMAQLLFLDLDLFVFGSTILFSFLTIA